MIVGGRAFVSDGSRVLAVGLADRRPAPVRVPPGGDEPPPGPGVTLTAAGDRLFARLGPTVVRPAGPKDEEAVLACFALRDGTNADAPLAKELWRVKPPAGEGKSPASWEGTPLGWSTPSTRSGLGCPSRA